MCHAVLLEGFFLLPTRLRHYKSVGYSILRQRIQRLRSASWGGACCDREHLGPLLSEVSQPVRYGSHIKAERTFEQGRTAHGRFK